MLVGWVPIDPPTAGGRSGVKRGVARLREHGCERVFVEVGPWRRTSLRRAVSSLGSGDGLVMGSLAGSGLRFDWLAECAADVRRRGARMVCLEECVDTGRPGGGQVFALVSALAASRRRREALRRAAARKACRMSRGASGRPRFFRCPERVRAAKELLRSGAGVAVTARSLGVSETTVRRWFPGGRASAFIGDAAAGAGA